MGTQQPQYGQVGVRPRDTEQRDAQLDRLPVGRGGGEPVADRVQRPPIALFPGEQLGERVDTADQAVARDTGVECAQVRDRRMLARQLQQSGDLTGPVGVARWAAVARGTVPRAGRPYVPLPILVVVRQREFILCPPGLVGVLAEVVEDRDTGRHDGQLEHETSVPQRSASRSPTCQTITSADNR